MSDDARSAGKTQPPSLWAKPAGARSWAIESSLPTSKRRLSFLPGFRNNLQLVLIGEAFEVRLVVAVRTQIKLFTGSCRFGL